MFGKKRAYLDYAAAAPVRKAAARAYTRAAAAFANPSSPHEEGRRAEALLENARTRIARRIEVKADDVVFTGSATEANALAILGTAAHHANAHMLYLPSAHASVVENMLLCRERGHTVQPLVLKDGRVDIQALRTQLRPNTVLISMDAVCGETGTIWNTRDVATLLQSVGERRTVLHVDASQAPTTQKMTRAHFGADLLTLDAAKVGGVRGISCLSAHRTIPLVPLYGGGGQERGLRPGTESASLAQAFATALEESGDEAPLFSERARTMQKELVQLITTKIPRVYRNGGAECTPHIVNLSFPGRDTDYLAVLLDEAGYAVSTRSACESDSLEGSRAVFALTSDRERSKTTLRISWGASTTPRDLSSFSEALAEAVRFIDNANR